MVKLGLRLPISFLVVASAASVGCDEPNMPAEAASFTGTASDRDDYAVGISMEGDTGILYVCGVDDAARPNSQWFAIGPDGAITAVADPDTARGDVLVSGEDAAGAVTLRDGTHLSFDLSRNVDPRLGVFSTVDAGCRTGLIAFGEGEAASAGTWCSDEGIFEQVTPIQPISYQGAWVEVASSPIRMLRLGPVEPRAFR
jgi:hypothetical protein